MGERKTDVVALGELLIDFIESGVSPQGNPLYEANPGGAPCNVLSMLQNLQRSTMFIGKIGRDAFGHQLKNAVESRGIGCEGICYDETVHTTLAFVSRTETGDRDFSFYRNPGADIMLREEDIREEWIAGASIFHFGSLSMTDEPVRSATRKAVALAEKYGCIRSFDPNLRPPLWQKDDDAREQIAWGMSHCDFLKISDNEILWFTGCETYDEAVAELQKTYHIPLICLSLGAEGSRAYTEQDCVEVSAFLNEYTIETTGAGDTFCACVLDGILKYGLSELNAERLREVLRFASAAASIVTTRKGALNVMPERSEVDALLARAEVE